MSTSSSDADDTPPNTAGEGSNSGNPWLVRLLLILSFGVAFGIEGMTLIRSYFFEEGEDETQQREVTPLRIGDDLLPATPVSERVTQMKITAQSDGPWMFRMEVRVVNDGRGTYRLSVRDLVADDGTHFEKVFTVEAPPADTSRLVATWPVGTDTRPRSLTAVAEMKLPSDSIRTAGRRVHFGHVPVQMER